MNLIFDIIIVIDMDVWNELDMGENGLQKEKVGSDTARETLHQPEVVVSNTSECM